MGVLVSKYNFGINNLRSRPMQFFKACIPNDIVHSHVPGMFIPKEVLGFKGHVPSFGGRSFG